MRLDRFLTLRLFKPLLTASRRSRNAETAILMYHSIDENADDGLHPYYRTVTTPAVFEQQMECLRQAGCDVLTLSQACAAAGDAYDSAHAPPPRAEASLPSPDCAPLRVVLTFDDGFRDFHTTAFPILERFGFGATVFLSTGYIDKTFITGRECLRTPEIVELAKLGVEFGSHTVSHPQLRKLPLEGVARELAGSKAAIEDIVGREVSLFSYPYRFPEEDPGFTARLADLLIDTGYAVGVTTAIGRAKLADGPLFLPRLPVNDCDDQAFFEAKLAGAYDWVHTGQLGYKLLQSKCFGGK